MNQTLLLILCMCCCAAGIAIPYFRPPANVVDNIVGVVNEAAGGISQAVKTIGGVVAGLNRRIG